VPTLTRLDDSLDRVRTGLESRARRISGRVGEVLAGHVSRPGKMLRARFCLHLGAALGVEPAKSEAAGRALELVHNASLLHDDCVDEADVRRGEPTPTKLYGVNVALLLGDLAFSQGLEEAIDISPNAPNLLVTTVREMTVGELQEEFLKGSVDVTFEAYMGIAARKTGALFEWAGSVLSELSPLPHEQADPPRLSCAAGILLQIVDDIHDYTLAGDLAGKEKGKDLSLGRMTLPAVLARADSKDFIPLWRSGDLKKITDYLVKNGYIEASRQKGREIVTSMRRMIAGLPVKDEARELDAFVEQMAKREF
jgi:geranylgeranyl pyrophosphate synthase